MRYHSLGITNADLAKIPIGFHDDYGAYDGDNDGDNINNFTEETLGTDPNNSDTDGDGYDDRTELENGYDPISSGTLSYDYSLANRLKGQILLQVESRGEAWYMNPVNGKRYYMKNGMVAYQMMRFMSLGISNADLNKISVYGEVETTWQTYTNAELGIAFDYPDSWGDLTLQYVDETMTLEEINGSEVFSGEGIWMKFSDHYSVNMLLASDNFSQFMVNSYNGDQDLNQGCFNLEDNNQQYCSEINLANQDTYGYYQYSNYECSAPQIKYLVPLNISNELSDYAGLQIQMFIREFPIDTDENGPCGFPEENIQENLEAIYTRENLEDNFLQGLEDFDRFLESLEFIN